MNITMNDIRLYTDWLLNKEFGMDLNEEEIYHIMFNYWTKEEENAS